MSLDGKLPPMTCREVESLILSEPDGALTAPQRAALSDHLVACPACQQLRARMLAALDAYRADHTRIIVPDVEAAWDELQAKLPAQPRQTEPERTRIRLGPAVWFGAPVAIAAAIAVFFTAPFRSPSPSPATLAPVGSESARADFVEAGDANASTMVYVDKESGWLVVWATDANDTKTSG